MLTLIKLWLKKALIVTAYFGGLLMMVYTLVRDARYGLLFLVFLIPQPNLWYKFHQYPFGKDFLDILYLAILLGTWFQNRNSQRVSNTLLVLVYTLMSVFSLVNSVSRFGLGYGSEEFMELLVEMKNYVQMLGLYYIVSRNVETEREARICIVVISIVVLLIGFRAYRSFYAPETFSYENRASGPFSRVGLTANHMGAFLAHYVALLGGLLLYDDDRRRKILYLAAIGFGVGALIFTYSRGAYIAILAILAYYGLRKKPALLIGLVVLIVMWKTLLPSSVVDRITMTRSADGAYDDSAAARVGLWNHAVDLFTSSPIFGIGYAGFRMSVPEGMLGDTHNFFMKTICEQGVVGLGILLFILYRAARSAHCLEKTGNSRFLRGVGLGFSGCLLALVVTNTFGDRWSYFVLGGYFWVIWGMTDKLVSLVRSQSESESVTS